MLQQTAKCKINFSTLMHKWCLLSNYIVVQWNWIVWVHMICLIHFRWSIFIFGWYSISTVSAPVSKIHWITLSTSKISCLAYLLSRTETFTTGWLHLLRYCLVCYLMNNWLVSLMSIHLPWNTFLACITRTTDVHLLNYFIIFVYIYGLLHKSMSELGHREICKWAKIVYKLPTI